MRRPGRTISPWTRPWLEPILVLAALLTGGCGTGDDAAAPTARPDASPPPPAAPSLTLPAGSRYFESGGRQAPVMMRNISAATPAAFVPLFAAARANGTVLVRLQLTQGFGYGTLGIDSRGGVVSAFAAQWDTVLDEAASAGLDVIPVFGIWGDWNDGTPALGFTHFPANPLNVALGGPAASPADLFADTPAQQAWLSWLGALVARWSGRTNIVGWEAFSELDLASGATQASATAFAERAHDVVRAADPMGRPVYASTSDLPLVQGQPWTDLWASPGEDVVSLHPYDANLDATVIARARTVLSMTEKPVLLGESGLDAASPDGTTITSSPAAPLGLESAIWAELTSGCATARALYWEDGYAAYFAGSGLPLVTARSAIERQAAAWLADKDFRGLAPLDVSGSAGLVGSVMGSADRALGWVRSELLVAPSWDAPPIASSEVTVTLPAGTPDSAWTVTLTAPDDGTTTETTGLSQLGTLSFMVSAPFQRMAFDAAAVR